jgi:hypothetical protein
VTPSATAPEGPPSRWSRLSPQHDTGLVAYLAALSGLSALGIDLVLPALGDVRSHFDLAPDATDVSLVVTTYIFGMGIGQVFYGPLADRFGRRPTVLGGLALYVAAAIGSALAPSLPAMLACRAVMGLGAASPRAMSLTIARDRFSGDAMTRVVSGPPQPRPHPPERASHRHVAVGARARARAHVRVLRVLRVPEQLGADLRRRVRAR